MSQDEIDRMVDEAEQNAEQDAQKRKDVEIRNGAETAVYAAEKMITENEEHISEELKADLEGKIGAVRSSLEGEDSSSIEVALQELQETVQKVGQEVYSKTGNVPGAEEEPESETSGSEAGTEEDNDNTVEGEYREV